MDHKLHVRCGLTVLCRQMWPNPIQMSYQCHEDTGTGSLISKAHSSNATPMAHDTGTTNAKPRLILPSNTLNIHGNTDSACYPWIGSSISSAWHWWIIIMTSVCHHCEVSASPGCTSSECSQCIICVTSIGIDVMCPRGQSLHPISPNIGKVFGSASGVL